MTMSSEANHPNRPSRDPDPNELDPERLEEAQRRSRDLALPAVSSLLDRLAADVILKHVPGRRVLDLGYGSQAVADWVRHRTDDHVSLVEMGALEPPGERATLPYAANSFDIVYSLRTLMHLGRDAETSSARTKRALAEAARVMADRGLLFVEIANPRSLRGLVDGIRNPMTIVDGKPGMVVEDRYSLTRYDTIQRFVRYLPPQLELLGAHGLLVLLPHATTLEIPLVGKVLARLEWAARDSPVLRHFGAHLLLVLRKVPDVVDKKPLLAGRIRASISRLSGSFPRIRP